MDARAGEASLCTGVGTTGSGVEAGEGVGGGAPAAAAATGPAPTAPNAMIAAPRYVETHLRIPFMSTSPRVMLSQSNSDEFRELNTHLRRCPEGVVKSCMSAR